MSRFPTRELEKVSCKQRFSEAHRLDSIFDPS